MTESASPPVAVIGAGPVGLAAASHLITRGLPVKVYEAGATVAAHVRNGPMPAFSRRGNSTRIRRPERSSSAMANGNLPARRCPRVRNSTTPT